VDYEANNYENGCYDDADSYYDDADSSNEDYTSSYDDANCSKEDENGYNESNGFDNANGYYERDGVCGESVGVLIILQSRQCYYKVTRSRQRYYEDDDGCYDGNVTSIYKVGDFWVGEWTMKAIAMKMADAVTPTTTTTVNVVTMGGPSLKIQCI